LHCNSYSTKQIYRIKKVVYLNLNFAVGVIYFIGLAREILNKALRAKKGSQTPCLAKRVYTPKAFAGKRCLQALGWALLRKRVV
jgi:hypothetical protein